MYLKMEVFAVKLFLWYPVVDKLVSMSSFVFECELRLPDEF